MPMIKDPTYNVYAKGGNVENRKNTPKKEIDYINKYSEEEIRVLIDNFYQNWHNKLNEIINKFILIPSR